MVIKLLKICFLYCIFIFKYYFVEGGIWGMRKNIVLLY
ncbi:putative membrane protein [Escherichia coli DEC11C]|nr:putative membrane protein [Escherichia coli DEC11C]KDV50896.1 membrane protein [Escherichia coli O45:H2 str. 2010C-4211]